MSAKNIPRVRKILQNQQAMLKGYDEVEQKFQKIERSQSKDRERRRGRSKERSSDTEPEKRRSKESEKSEEDLDLDVVARQPERKILKEIEDLSSEEEEGGAGMKGFGLYNYQIADAMKKYHKNGFVGVYAIDKLYKMPIDPNKESLSFIMNTMPSTIKMGHWTGIYLTKENLEYYDSFGNLPSDMFITNIKPILHKWVGNKPLQFKINRIKTQSVNSDNCGYYAMKFLIDRYNGKSFKEITKYNKLIGVLKSEKQIRAFKKKFHLTDFENISAE